MNKDILLWSNIEIINALDKWGVLTLRNLHKLLTSNDLTPNARLLLNSHLDQNRLSFSFQIA